MAFFDAINDIVNALGEKANSAVEATKLTVSLNQQKKNLADAQHKLGEYYLTRFIEEGTVDEEALVYAEQGKVAQEAINDLNEQLKGLEDILNMPITPGKKRCEICGAYVDNTANFCPECGAAFPEETEDNEEEFPEPEVFEKRDSVSEEILEECEAPELMPAEEA